MYCNYIGFSTNEFRIPSSPPERKKGNFVDIHDTDENLYDLYLHKRDTSYTFKQLVNWLKEAGRDDES